MKLQRLLPTSNPHFVDVETDRVDHFLSKAAKLNTVTTDEIITRLDAGQEIAFDTDWYDRLRCGEAHQRKIDAQKARQKSVKMVRCACGHTISQNLVTSTSQGSSCPDCYDRMSD